MDYRRLNAGGYSGCELFLCENEKRGISVRKVSSDLSYNSRLKRQAYKQMNYRGKTIRTPRVLGEGITEVGKYYFDMEYIQGITLSEYMKNIEINKISEIVRQLLDEVSEQAKITEEAKPEIFEQKILGLERLLLEKNNDILDEAIGILIRHDWTEILISPCHGDLTLENIIVKGDRLYFIDFLDSFYDSWIIDLGTVMQDVQTMWSYRYVMADINTSIRLMIFRDIFVDAVKQRWGENILKEVYFCLLLKLIRIIPYTEEQRTYKFLIKKIESILALIERERYI